MPKRIPNQQNLPCIMKLNEITAAMQVYAAQRNQAGLDQMQNWLNQGNAFTYNRDSTIPDDSYVHAYPGIVSGQLVFFVIAAEYDQSTTIDIENHIQVCPIKTLTPQASNQPGMPEDEALFRIKAWKDYNLQWISYNIATTNSVFNAFLIPNIDTAEGNIHNAFLALNPNPKAKGAFDAELIIEDIAGSGVLYKDTILPCPPYDAPERSASLFYLISLV